MRRALFALIVAAAASGCSVLVDNAIQDPEGPACNSTAQCFEIAGREFDCNQRCVDQICVSGMQTSDGIGCGTDGTQICVAGECVEERCGDGYTNRQAEPPEYCDDGDTNDMNGCTTACTRSCVPPARVICNESGDPNDPCDGVESCAMNVCTVTAQLADGTSCPLAGQDGGMPMGVCERGRCVTPE